MLKVATRTDIVVRQRASSKQALVHILGGGKELVSSGDETEDKIDRAQFAQKYQQMHRLVRESDGTTLLYAGRNA